MPAASGPCLGFHLPQAGFAANQAAASHDSLWNAATDPLGPAPAKNLGPGPAPSEAHQGLRHVACNPSTTNGSAARRAPLPQAQSHLPASELLRFRVTVRDGWDGSDDSKPNNDLSFSSPHGADPAPIRTVDDLDSWVLATCVPKYDDVIGAAHGDGSLEVTKGCHQEGDAHFDTHILHDADLAGNCHFDCQTCLPVITGGTGLVAALRCFKDWFGHLKPAHQRDVIASPSHVVLRARRGRGVEDPAHHGGGRQRRGGGREGGSGRRRGGGGGRGRGRDNGGYARAPPPPPRGGARGRDDDERPMDNEGRDEGRERANLAILDAYLAHVDRELLERAIAAGERWIDREERIATRMRLDRSVEINSMRIKVRAASDELEERQAFGQSFAIVRAASADEPPAPRHPPTSASLRGRGGAVLGPDDPVGAATFRAA